MSQDDPKTMSVPAAGKKYFNLGKNGSYNAAKRGEIPTIKIGSRLRVPVIALERMLSDPASLKDTISSKNGAQVRIPQNASRDPGPDGSLLRTAPRR
jgi:hypothetical protein